MTTMTLSRRHVATHTLAVLAGTLVITLATQVSMNLPFTPVPITGQTFGVLVVAMLLGRTRGVAAVMTYLTAGLMGAPVFANWTSITAFFGPTSGYLLSFLPAAWLAGTLVQRRPFNTFAGSIGTGLLAHTVILAIGSAVLGAFVGIERAWAFGVAPFLVGEVVKSVLAAMVVCSVRGHLPRGAHHGS